MGTGCASTSASSARAAATGNRISGSSAWTAEAGRAKGTGKEYSNSNNCVSEGLQISDGKRVLG